ncbi:hypothetical protein SNE35_29940 [Paucibacter sp. R3-3]|uniref:HNH endonuclease n=1 Tax=Roseateles agri TaxID=3098619 RepID=A0ABU5DR08_9BURK|nr:hypothetical protein [Paucibacter sp. R3-3]MDY0748757.1 hypothetical protein [Paucibacter sp. R3-3]
MLQLEWISELDGAEEAHRIQMGRNSEFARSALSGGVIPFSCTYLTAEQLARMDPEELLDAATQINRSMRAARNDVDLVQAVVLAGPTTLFWTVVQERTYWACAADGPLLIGADYRYRHTRSGWHEVRRLNTGVRTSDLPASIAKRDLYGTHNPGYLPEFRTFVRECLALTSDHEVRPDAPQAPDDWTASIRSMALNAQSAAAESGLLKLSATKAKYFGFPSREDAEAYITLLLEEQGYRCRLTGIPLKRRGQHSPVDAPYLPSLDRRDSNGHYEPGNLQVVCQFINRWKAACDEGDFLGLLNAVKQAPGRLPSLSTSPSGSCRS